MGLLAALPACGAEPPDAGAPDNPAPGFPVTVEHRFGSTEIPAPPERVVSVGFTDQDYLLALGVVPVAVREWFGEQPFATWPWATDELGDAEPVVLPREELDFEQIAALRSDLIVGVYSGMTEPDHQLLARIAPTVAQPAGGSDFAVAWQDQTRITGRALGRDGRAQELVAAVEGRVAATRAAHPQFARATAVIASATAGEYYVYGPNSTSGDFLVSLGFEIPPEIVELTDNANSFHAFSGERLDLVDLDLVVWLEGVDDEGPAALLANPLYQQLAVHTEGRDLFLGYDLYAGALSFSSVLSVPFLLDRLVPAMAVAVDGDPTTEPVLA